jgi:2-phosphosulfolactate phosphatase
MRKTVVIDCFPASAARYCSDHVVVAVDVIRATTLAVTAVALGHRCFAAVNLDEAYKLHDRIPGAMLAGELAGDMPAGFDMNNSPADLAAMGGPLRPIVMLSTSGTELMLIASRSRHGAFLACFRNYSSVARHVSTLEQNVAVIGAGSRNEFREEDQMCCAWVAEQLISSGYCAADSRTSEIIKRWSGVPATACASGNSVGYLRRTGQMRDYDFIVNNIDDLDFPVKIVGNEVSVVEVERPAIVHAVFEAA